ncbi:hypothetical protein [Bradyrhizobium yuanmingense]|uniref:hypothetical protein n=1 Tax=Bradyrhizobium yuanmingense TaxID=108015 RepID=UPI0004BB1676|nr:hypothetical protein [Bradyrhizobium yuanmingense]
MKSILNNLRRIFVDDGRDDRDFTERERQLQEVHKHLLEAADGLARAASILADVIRLRH